MRLIPLSNASPLSALQSTPCSNIFKQINLRSTPSATPTKVCFQLCAHHWCHSRVVCACRYHHIWTYQGKRANRPFATTSRTRGTRPIGSRKALAAVCNAPDLKSWEIPERHYWILEKMLVGGISTMASMTNSHDIGSLLSRQAWNTPRLAIFSLQQ